MPPFANRAGRATRRAAAVLLAAVAVAPSVHPAEVEPAGRAELEAAQRSPELDAAGRVLLDPLRLLALRPTELVARLGLPPTATVADLGAGPGFLTLPLLRAVPQGRVVATDRRATYLTVAARRAAAAGLGNLETRVTGADAPSFGERSIDLALLCQVDHLVPDRAAYLKALTPSLRPGGHIVLVNSARYRDAALAAAGAVSLRVVDEWAPSRPFFVLVLAPAREPR
jgi:predicted O-methyltransferase YrrM